MEHKNGDKWMCNIFHCGAVIPFMLTKKDDVWIGDDGETYCPIEFLYQVEPHKPEEGDKCPECKKGELTYHVEVCTCHINPPCSACVDAPLTCNECGAEFDEE